MVSLFAQHEGCSRSGWSDVFHEVWFVDALPVLRCEAAGFIIGELSEALEVRIRVSEGALFEPNEPLSEPVRDVCGASIHVDGEVEEVTDGEWVLHGGGLQHVEPLHDEDVGLGDGDELVWQDVVDEVRVHRDRDLGDPALHLCDEAQQSLTVIRLREAFAVRDASALELIVRQQKSVGGDEFDAWSLWPAGKQVAKDARHGRFSDRNRPGDSDYKRGFRGGLAEKFAGARVQLSLAGGVLIEEATQWPVHLIDFGQVERFTESSKRVKFSVGEGQWRIVCEPSPRCPVNLSERGQDVGLDQRLRLGRVLSHPS